MANAQKYTRAACGHLAAHYERKKDEKGEYIKFGNQDIDPQKTHLNYNLAPRRGLEQIDFIRQRTRSVVAKRFQLKRSSQRMTSRLFTRTWNATSTASEIGTLRWSMKPPRTAIRRLPS